MANNLITKQDIIDQFNGTIYQTAYNEWVWSDTNYPIASNNKEWNPNPQTELLGSSKVAKMTSLDADNPITGSQVTQLLSQYASNYTCIRRVRFWHHWTGDKTDTIYDETDSAITSYKTTLNANLGLNAGSLIQVIDFSNLLTAWRNVVNNGTYITFEAISHAQQPPHGSRLRR